MSFEFQVLDPKGFLIIQTLKVSLPDQFLLSQNVSASHDVSLQEKPLGSYT